MFPDADSYGDRPFNPPRQERSRRALDRIVKATLKLLREHPFRDIAVAAIAREAGISIGTLYNRFPTKDAILLHVFETVVFPDLEQWTTAVIKPDRKVGGRLEDFIRRYLLAIRAAFVKHRLVLAPLSLLARDPADPAIRRILGDLNDSIHREMEAALLLRSDQIRHPQPALAVRTAMLWLGAAMRERFLYGEPFSGHGHRDEDLVDELARGAAAYLSGG